MPASCLPRIRISKPRFRSEAFEKTKNYAGKLAIRFTYATNGQGIYGIDMQEGAEGELPRYPAPGELWNLTFVEPNAFWGPRILRAWGGR